jgi:hypothetical protein
MNDYKFNRLRVSSGVSPCRVDWTKVIAPFTGHAVDAMSIGRLSAKGEGQNCEIDRRLVRLRKHKKGDAGASPLSGAY